MATSGGGTFLFALLLFCLTSTLNSESTNRVSQIQANNSFALPDRHQDVKNQVDKALWPVHVLYEGFLGVVQLQHFNDLNETLNFTTAQDVSDSFSESWEEWIIYFIGFAICVGVGVLGFIVMLFTAFVLPCCRACGKCGGKQNHKDGKSSNRDRVGCSVTLAIFNVLLILGATCMYVTNMKLYDQLVGNATVFDNIATNTQSIGPYFEKTVNEMNTTVYDKYVETMDDVFAELYYMPDDFLLKLDNETQIIKGYTQLEHFANNINELSANLTQITNISTELMSNSSALNTSIYSVKVDIMSKLENCSDPDCLTAKNTTEQLALNVDYSAVNVTSAYVAVMSANESDVAGLIYTVRAEIVQIEDAINSSTVSAIKEAENEADAVQAEIANFIQELDSGVKDIVGSLSDISTTMDDVKTAIVDTNTATYIYWSIFVLATLICIIIFANFMGIFYVCAPRPKKKESCARCSRRQGAHWLMAGGTCTFIGYWLFILIVMLTFAVGGVLYTEVCRNAVYYEDSREVLKVFDNIINDLLAMDEIDIYFFDTYITCASDASLYTAFKFAENGYNITEMVNMSAIEDAINQIKSVEVDIPPIALYNPELQIILDTLDEGTSLDYAGMMSQLAMPVTTEDMSELAKQLQALTTYDMTAEINTLTTLHADAMNMETLAKTANESLQFVVNILPKFGFTNISGILNNTEIKINSEGEVFASRLINSTADAVYIQVEGLAEMIISDVENVIGRCLPVYSSLTGLIDTVCVQALYPLNVFWFSLGWCVFFFIPHVIMSCKLTKLFRKYDPYKPGELKKGKKPKKSKPKKKNDGRLDGDIVAGSGPVLEGHSNDAFDAMEEYRKELALKEAVVATALVLPRPSTNNPIVRQPSYHDFGPDKYGKPFALPRPMATKPIGGLHYSGSNYQGPNYGELWNSDPTIAHMY